MRLKSVKNIQKITKSMKMVSAAKFGKAERELRPARVYGAGASGVANWLLVMFCFAFKVTRAQTHNRQRKPSALIDSRRFPDN